MDFWSYFWLLVWWFFFVAYLMVLFQIFGDLFRDDELGGFAKALWVLALIFANIISALVYLIVRGKGMAARTMKRNAEMVSAQEDYIRSVAAPSSGSSGVEQLAQAKALLDSGAITPEEFAAIKAKALA
ncbi:phospholipase D-like protein [Humibacillus xanthopallidus]|uniref:Phospholipase D-like protein n=1 Tax=Humibacillus xanthopallidus TaxID=412689 RepID=A0A543PUJ5_9MICO|nr:SHOCT domain-containing protein [Humibacillus xanthopallidus]TQN47752.1 phospholipase D-like protein [Humibacillus xanthopallidus]